MEHQAASRYGTDMTVVITPTVAGVDERRCQTSEDNLRISAGALVDSGAVSGRDWHGQALDFSVHGSLFRWSCSGLS